MSGWWAWGISPLTVAHCVLTATCRLLQRDRRRHKGWGPAGSLGPGGGRAFSLGAGRWAHGSWQAGERGVGEWQGCGGQGPPFHRRTGTTLPSPLPGPPPLPGCCRPCHGSCHLPPPFVRPFRSPPLECSSVWEKAQCLHPSQTSCSLVPDRVTSVSGSSPCHGDASRPAARGSACPSPAPPCPRLVPRETSFTMALYSTHAWPSFQFTHLGEALCSRRSSQ